MLIAGIKPLTVSSMERAAITALHQSALAIGNHTYAGTQH